VGLLHLPLKVDDRGRLVRADRRQALFQMLRVMSSTYAGTWAPDPEFGIRQCFEPKRRGGADQENAPESVTQGDIAALNRSLERLGMSDFRIAAIVRASSSEHGVLSYSVTVVSSSYGPEILELRI
jgi:hypothetical protein